MCRIDRINDMLKQLVTKTAARDVQLLIHRMSKSSEKTISLAG